MCEPAVEPVVSSSHLVGLSSTGMTTPTSLLQHHLAGNVLTQATLAKPSLSPLAGTVKVARCLLPGAAAPAWRGPGHPLLPVQAVWLCLCLWVASCLLVGLCGRVGSALGLHCPTSWPEAAPIHDALMGAGRSDAQQKFGGPRGGE